MTLNAWGLVLIILVTIGIVVAILLFERPRARRIEEDLRRQAAREPRQDT
jgi:ABC-type bacteriocin/lantibiotic exporter with double-glycine peptidase domain